jgi:hypothetical protein
VDLSFKKAGRYAGIRIGDPGARTSPVTASWHTGHLDRRSSGQLRVVRTSRAEKLMATMQPESSVVLKMGRMEGESEITDT